MSFKLSRFLYLIISFIIGIFFLIFGLFSVALPWSSFLQNAATQFISHHTLIFFFFGLGFILVGVSLMIYAMIHSRHRYIPLKIGSRAVSLDENLIHQYLEAYWQKNFPQLHVPFDLSLKKNSLEIVADFPSLPLEDQKVFLERVKHDFGDLFGNTLGYPHDVHLIASFQKNAN